MQPNVITLAVDEENNGSTVNHTFSRFEEHLNRASYIGSDHVIGAPDTLTLYRTFPKPSGNFKGVAKTSFKFSKSIQVTGVDGISQLSSPIIVETSFSIPVGATAATVKIARQRALALLDRDDLLVPLNEQLMV